MTASAPDEFEAGQYERLKRGFAAYYRDTLYPYLKQKEDLRRKYVSRFWFLTLVSAVVLPMIMLLVYFLNRYYQKNIDWSLVYIAVAVAIYIMRSPFAAYRRQVKNNVMDLFVKFFPGFSYENGQGLPPDIIEQSRIFPPFMSISADDCFYGEYEGVGIHVYEQILRTRVYTGKGRSKEKTVFRGIAVELDMNKKFSGQTIVVKDAGLFNTFKHYAGMERVKLEDVSFEKIFEVYATDQVEARYLLTTAFMERLLKLCRLYAGKKVEASFFNNKILIAIDTREDMFEPCSFFKTNLNMQKFDTVFEQFWTVFSIIHVLKLNQNLGM